MIDDLYEIPRLNVCIFWQQELPIVKWCKAGRLERVNEPFFVLDKLSSWIMISSNK